MAKTCNFSTFKVTSNITYPLFIEKELIKKWMVSGSIKKAYDRSVKGYVYITDMNLKL